MSHAPTKRPAPLESTSLTSGPIVVFSPIGDGRSLARALARVLVRRELIRFGAIPDTGDCIAERKAG